MTNRPLRFCKSSPNTYGDGVRFVSKTKRFVSKTNSSMHLWSCKPSVCTTELCYLSPRSPPLPTALLTVTVGVRCCKSEICKQNQGNFPQLTPTVTLTVTVGVRCCKSKICHLWFAFAQRKLAKHSFAYKASPTVLALPSFDYRSKLGKALHTKGEQRLCKSHTVSDDLQHQGL